MPFNFLRWAGLDGSHNICGPQAQCAGRISLQGFAQHIAFIFGGVPNETEFAATCAILSGPIVVRRKQELVSAAQQLAGCPIALNGKSLANYDQARVETFHVVREKQPHRRDQKTRRTRGSGPWTWRNLVTR